MTPCDCGNATPGPFARGMCRVCWLALNDPRYAALWSGLAVPPPATPAPRRAAACAHRGRELTGAERAAAGLGHARRWSLCLHPEKPLGEHVCGCMKPVGCGPRCPEYSQAPAEGGKMTM
jgi:hypothetical protein